MGIGQLFLAAQTQHMITILTSHARDSHKVEILRKGVKMAFHTANIANEFSGITNKNVTCVVLKRRCRTGSGKPQSPK